MRSAYNQPYHQSNQAPDVSRHRAVKEEMVDAFIFRAKTTPHITLPFPFDQIVLSQDHILFYQP